jgi:hypothetical protein
MFSNVPTPLKDASKLNLQKSNPGCGLAIVEGKDNNSAREVFMESKEVIKNSNPPIGGKAETGDMQASVRMKTIRVTTLRESQECPVSEPNHRVKNFVISLPTFIEII